MKQQQAAPETACRKTVTLVGRQNSGKTSLIAALTSYARNGAWAEVPSMAGLIQSVEITAADNLISDLELYARGQRLPKTRPDRRERAYFATFRVTDRENRTTALTVTELPGELTQEDGRNAWMLREQFPEILNSDVLVLCLDDRRLSASVEDGPVLDEIARTLRLTEQVQQICQRHRGDRRYLPLLRVYTKCPDLEDPMRYEDIRTQTVRLNYRADIPDYYLLRPEELSIRKSRIRHQMERSYSRFCPETEYVASMRCSAYGHEPRDAWCENGELHPPQPKNIHLLMQWLLTATGCIPVELEGVQCRAGRRQFRAENPAIDGDDFREEALLRQYLFENVGTFDVEATRADSVLKRLMLRARMNRNPNGNHN